MSRPVIVLPAAKRDVRNQALWLASRNLIAVDDFLVRLDEVYDLISQNPLCGRARPELAAGLRSFPVGRHVIFYRPTDNHVDIVRVLAAAQDVNPALFD